MTPYQSPIITLHIRRTRLIALLVLLVLVCLLAGIGIGLRILEIQQVAEAALTALLSIVVALAGVRS